jgi:hypothetical protein
VRGRRARINVAAVTNTVCVAKHELRRCRPLDDELPAVLCPMMRSTQHDEPIGIVRAALRARIDVMDV